MVPYAALVCGTCRACARGRENLCENVAGVRGFHVDGFAQELTNHPARLTAKLPDGVDLRDAACVAVAYATVEHMLFDNAQLEPGEMDPGARRRLRHRQHRHPRGEVARLHRHHHRRQRRQGGKGDARSAPIT